MLSAMKIRLVGGIIHGLPLFLKIFHQQGGPKAVAMARKRNRKRQRSKARSGDGVTSQVMYSVICLPAGMWKVGVLHSCQVNVVSLDSLEFVRAEIVEDCFLYWFICHPNAGFFD